MTRLDQIEAILRRDGPRCYVCGKPVNLYNGQRAHRIPQDKQLVRIYGRKVIDHPLNMRIVCSLECNNKVSIRNQPVERIKLLTAIFVDLALQVRRAS